MQSFDEKKRRGHAIAQKLRLNLGQTHCPQPHPVDHPVNQQFHQLPRQTFKSDESDDQTVLFNPRKYTASGDQEEEILNQLNRQFEKCGEQDKKRGSFQNSYIKTHHRRRIFGSLKTKKDRKQSQKVAQIFKTYQDPQQTVRNMKQSTNRIGFKDVGQKSKLGQKCNQDYKITPIKAVRINNQKCGTVQMKSHKQLNFNLLSPSVTQDTFQVNGVSPIKINFTYKQTPLILAPTPPTPPTPPIPQQKSKPKPEVRGQSKSKTQNFSSLCAQVAPYYNNLIKKEEQGQLKQKKNIFPYKKGKFRAGTLGVSWGNKIRTDLTTPLKEEPLTKLKKECSSRVSLACKESVIIHGQKVDLNNLKINDSFSNTSVCQDSKRYFDEDLQFLPQIKKISYNNIDFSSEDSLEDHPHQTIKPTQLLADFHQHHPVYDQELPKVSRMQSRKVIEIKSEEPILEQMEHEIGNSQVKVQPVKKGQRFLPVVLVVLASMLLLIQISI